MNNQWRYPSINYLESSRYTMILNNFIEYIVMILIAISAVSITSGSHAIGFPLYKLNPMHWAIYFTIMVRKPPISSILILAFALPFTSSMATGHPILIKSMLIGVELSIYGIVFLSAIKYFKIVPIFAFIISQVVGHTVYYLFKYILIKSELFESALVSTSILLQLFVFGILGCIIYTVGKMQLIRDIKNRGL